MLPECSGAACQASPAGYTGIMGQTLIRTRTTFVFIDAAHRRQRMEPSGVNQYDREYTPMR
jgi:hypothetical protein